MKIPAVFLDNKKRNLILWLTDMIVAIASYFYITNPFYIQRVLEGMDLAAIRPDIDPQIFQSPIFQEYMFRVISIVAILTIAVIALFHTLTFYKCYQRKRAAIAYVKIYSFLAAFSLVMWFLYNVSLLHSLILIPATVYTYVFLAEKQPRSEQPAFDNILTNDHKIQ